MTTTANTADVCIVGTGIAGLNAAFVASQYLGNNGHIVLVDRRAQPGGMWVDTYDYVRLHQPHAVFTAGNIEWTLGRERSYLATRPEVVDHFAHCLKVIKQGSHVDERWGREYVSHDAPNGSVQVTLRDAAGQTEVIHAKRLIKASGYNVGRNPSLPVTSTRVRSVSPDHWDPRGAEMAGSTAPVWIIGSGKTAMDTAHLLITEYPDREVNLVTGSGTYFANRDRFFPTGRRRWVGGSRPNHAFRKLALRFDGTNENVCRDWFCKHYGSVPTPSPHNYFFAILSEQETRTITDGLHAVVKDHFVDVIDRDDSPQLVLRSGEAKPIPEGSWIVNCTGYLMRSEQPYESYCSAGGDVLSIRETSPLFFSAFGGYYLAHLMFLGKLADVPLYEVDIPGIHGASRDVMPWVAMSLLMYNLGLIFDAVPMKVFQECGADFDRWYPLPRKLAGGLMFALTHKRDCAHYRHALDTVGERFGVRCGPIIH